MEHHNTSCESGVGVLSGGGKVAVVGGRSGPFSQGAGYEGRRSAMRDSGLRSAQDGRYIPDGRYIRTINRTSRGDTIIKIVFVFLLVFKAKPEPTG